MVVFWKVTCTVGASAACAMRTRAVLAATVAKLLLKVARAGVPVWLGLKTDETSLPDSSVTELSRIGVLVHGTSELATLILTS